MGGGLGEVVLVRHGQTPWSLSGQHTGISEVELTEVGTRQAAALGDQLSGWRFAVVLTSPRQRARHTARLAGLLDARVDADLAEWDYGAYEGRTTADISAELGRQWSIWSDPVPPGQSPGESVEQVGERARSVLARVAPTVTAGRNVALVGHGHSLRVLAAMWLGQPPTCGRLWALSAGSISVLGHEHDRPVIGSWNQTGTQ